MKPALSRRTFVKAAGALAGAGLPAVGRAMAGQPLVLLDPRIRPGRAPDTAVMLSDPLRQWQGSLRDTVAATGAIAQVRWDMAVMLRHLCREARLPVAVRPSGPALFTVHIGARRKLVQGTGA